MRVLDQLVAMKGQFGREAAKVTASLLETLMRLRMRDTPDLILLHETILFLRAYPQSLPGVLRLADKLLFTFMRSACPRESTSRHSKVLEISGIAGTALSTNFSHEFASSLVASPRLGSAHRLGRL